MATKIEMNYNYSLGCTIRVVTYLDNLNINKVM